MGGWLYTASHSIFPPRASAAVSPVCLPLRSASVEPAQYMKKLYEGAFLTPEDKQSPVTPSSTMKSAFTSQGPLGLVTKPLLSSVIPLFLDCRQSGKESALQISISAKSPIHSSWNASHMAEWSAVRLQGKARKRKDKSAQMYSAFGGALRSWPG